MTTIKLKRVYEAPSRDDGRRILVERLWPRGIKKDALDMDLWLKEIAPSTELRKWFSHDPAKWKQFQEKYTKELEDEKHAEAVKEIVQALKKGNVTLLYSSKDTAHNNAVVLKNYLAL